ncbi:MAG: hypothetical protein MZV64_73420 [Ignavibacteriales bacterium]|nr:hypothetical protein [Ignavibacteriales bacterium]
MALSIVSFAVSVWRARPPDYAASQGRASRPWPATLVFALNPNVLYLQSTPMTEPLLMALIARWRRGSASRPSDPASRPRHPARRPLRWRRRC